MIARILRRARLALSRSRVERGFDDEFEFHLEMESQRYQREGMSPADARARARREFGALAGTKDQVREAHGMDLVESVLEDLRFALRLFIRRPGFALLATLTLGLGIGAATAIFSAIHPILIAPLPYPDGSRLVSVSERSRDGTSNGIGYATVDDIRQRSHSFENLAAITSWQPTLTGRDVPERLTGANVSYSFFRVLGVTPALGRDFLPEDDRPGVPRVAILSHALWQSRFAGDSTILGRSISLDETPYTVVGVMPATFRDLKSASSEIWKPLRYDATLPYACRTCHHVRTLGRLKPGLSQEAARRELDGIFTQLKAEHPAEYSATGMLVVGLQQQITGAVRPALLAVFGAVVLLLLIACANVTHLLLARAAQRKGEFALRASLGAGRGRVIRQLLVESLLLAAISGAIGIGIALLGMRLLVALAPPALPRVEAIHLHAPILLFSFAVTLLAGVAFGLIPAMHATRGNLHPALKQSGRRATGSRSLTRSSLVISEVALALMLLIGAGLMVRTMRSLLAISPGFDADRLLTLQVQTTGAQFGSDTTVWRYFDQVRDAVASLPGVTAVALTSQLPLSGDFDGFGVHAESHPNPNPEDDPSGFRYAVSPGYLEMMQIPIRSGRSILASDDAGQTPIVLLGEALAAQLFPGVDPVGQRIRIGGASGGPWRTVVGVVGDVKQVSLIAARQDAVYLPQKQWVGADGAMSIVARTASDPQGMIAAAQSAVWSIDANQPIPRIATMESLLRATEAERQFTMQLFGAFAMLALLFAGAGIYGVLAGTVTDRYAELGVRAALGASRIDIVRMIVRQAMHLVGAGIGLGVVGALLLSRLLGAMLHGVRPVDPVTYFAVGAGVILVAVGASSLPAWRASRVSPVRALKME